MWNKDEQIQSTIKQLTAINNVDISIIVVFFFLWVPLIVKRGIGIFCPVNGKILHQSVHWIVFDILKRFVAGCLSAFQLWKVVSAMFEVVGGGAIQTKIRKGKEKAMMS
jgi:hypothetical protein